MGAESQVGDTVSYYGLLRFNKNFRWLWLGNVVSLLGDWFSFIALISVVQDLSGSPLALAFVFVAKMLPGAIASPLAGVLVDRFDRRYLMIACDVARGFVVLGLLFVNDAGDIALAYVLTTVQVVISAVFQPAQSASVPNVTSGRELLTANTLMAASWSVMLALGAALGGFATEWFGPRAVFVIDSVSYFVSGGFIALAVIPQSTETFEKTKGLIRTAARDIMQGWSRMRQRAEIGRIALSKASWSIGGGGLVFMLALIGQEMMPQAPDVGIGWLFAARGIGTGIGPVVSRKWFLDQRRWPVLIGLFVAFSGVCYVTIGHITWSFLIVALVVVAHAASGANWVLSTVLLQERSLDEYRGRIFATEWLLVMMADSISILAAGMLLEAGVVGLRSAVLGFGFLQIVSGLGWALWMRFCEGWSPSSNTR